MRLLIPKIFRIEGVRLLILLSGAQNTLKIHLKIFRLRRAGGAFINFRKSHELRGVRLLVSDFENLKSRGALNNGEAFNSYSLVVYTSMLKKIWIKNIYTDIVRYTWTSVVTLDPSTNY